MVWRILSKINYWSLLEPILKYLWKELIESSWRSCLHLLVIRFMQSDIQCFELIPFVSYHLYCLLCRADVLIFGSCRCDYILGAEHPLTFLIGWVYVKCLDAPKNGE